MIGARDFADQIYDLALLRELVRVGRDMVQGALDTSADVNPRGRIEEAEIALYRVAEDGQVGGGVKTFGQTTMLAVEVAERARNSGGHLSGHTTGLDGLNSKIGGMHRSTLVHIPVSPALGQTGIES